MHRERAAKNDSRCASGPGPEGRVSPSHAISVHLNLCLVVIAAFWTYMAIHNPKGFGQKARHGLNTHSIGATDAESGLSLQASKAAAAAVPPLPVYNSEEFRHELTAPVKQALRNTLDHIPAAVQSEEQSVASTLQQQLVQAQERLERRTEAQAAVQEAWDVFAVFRSESQLGLSKGSHKSSNRSDAS